MDVFDIPKMWDCEYDENLEDVDEKDGAEKLDLENETEKLSVKEICNKILSTAKRFFDR